ncbi:H-NS histone family protein [Burkholderia contaminans]|uniref:H-NS histone family protein n=1 Tax=Burkholderia cepacia complex TaxID=87882 RepID=UPI001CF1558C|nr:MULTISPECIES: H-NS histone family protein [Burkholderia cepacia complex]MCA7888812.1 H-NS histone family protein [Burkholderia contaminans]MDN7576562.1 H-NS histone family protein [Burkholderia contaminans]MDN7669891.1 H-NS histone family protein [Burkholderia vietnamiensis]
MTTQTYKGLKAQIHTLEKQAEELRQAELQTVIAEIREKVQEYQLTPEDIFGGRRKKPKAKVTLPPKYRNPKTGQEWSGRGRAPLWLANVKNRDKFLIG